MIDIWVKKECSELNNEKWMHSFFLVFVCLILSVLYYIWEENSITKQNESLFWGIEKCGTAMAVAEKRKSKRKKAHLAHLTIINSSIKLIVSEMASADLSQLQEDREDNWAKWRYLRNGNKDSRRRSELLTYFVCVWVSVCAWREIICNRSMERR